MILIDFLSRQKYDNSNPHEIIPISFNMQNVLQSRYYNINEREEGKYLVQTRLEVHGVDKGIDTNIRPEKRGIKPIISSEVKDVPQIKPRLGQGRAGIK